MKKNTPEYYFNNLMILKEYLLKNRDSIEPKLNMRCYRGAFDMKDYECKSFGCIIGHAVAIPELRACVSRQGSEITFSQFTVNAFNLNKYGGDWDDWNFLFGQNHPNSIDAFIERLDEYFQDTYPKEINEQ